MYAMDEALSDAAAISASFSRVSRGKRRKKRCLPRIADRTDCGSCERLVQLPYESDHERRTVNDALSAIMTLSAEIDPDYRDSSCNFGTPEREAGS